MGQKRMREMATEETVRGERKRIHKENDLVSGQVLSGQEGAYYTVGASWEASAPEGKPGQNAPRFA